MGNVSKPLCPCFSWLQDLGVLVRYTRGVLEGAGSPGVAFVAAEGVPKSRGSGRKMPTNICGTSLPNSVLFRWLTFMRE